MRWCALMLLTAILGIVGCGRTHSSRLGRRVLARLSVPNAAAATLRRPRPLASSSSKPRSSGCPAEMAQVGKVCVDRWEDELVQRGAKGVFRTHPYYEVPARGVVYEARSAPGVFPQAYINRPESAAACREAGKRLCTLKEWSRACRGAKNWPFPYGPHERAGRCNTGKLHLLGRFYGENPRFWSYRHDFNDPRLDQVPGFLAKTGEYPGCVTDSGIDDMVGNLHEWVQDTVGEGTNARALGARAKEAGHGIFMGGFYSTRDEHGYGCGFITIGHQPAYHDYSTGFRCCKSLDATDVR